MVKLSYKKLKRIAQAGLYLLWNLILVAIIPVVFAFVLSAIFTIGKTDVSEPSENTADGSPESRLATVIAFKAGLIRLSTEKENQKIIDWELSNDREKYTGFRKPSFHWIATNVDLDTCGSNITSGVIVAVESYLRPAWVRSLEIDLVYMISTLTGHYPDLSLGVAQIKLSTARSLLEDASKQLNTAGVSIKLNLSDSVLFSDISNFYICTSVGLTEMAILMRGKANDAPSTHALRHVGGKSIPTITGVVEYDGIVNTIVKLLLPTGDPIENRDILANIEAKSREPKATEKQNISTDNESDESSVQVSENLIGYEAAQWPNQKPAYCLAFLENNIKLRVVDKYYPRQPLGVPDFAAAPWPQTPNKSKVLVVLQGSLAHLAEITDIYGLPVEEINSLLSITKFVASKADVSKDKIKFAGSEFISGLDKLQHSRDCQIFLYSEV